MHVVLSAILAMALGLLPIGTARTDTTMGPSAGMSCHQAIGGMQAMNGDDQAPARRMQDCADHCLSQVNSQTMYARLPGPSLGDAIEAQLGVQIDLGKVRYRDPPDPPPPRSSV